MNFSKLPDSSPARNGRILYARLPLKELLLRIVEESDAEALVHFHDHRTIFSYLHEPRLLFAEYADRLRLGAGTQSWGNLAQPAYDLLLDRFSRLPRNGERGIDCRRYFRAVLKVFADQPKRDELHAELVLAEITQRFVCRHYALSLKECQRNTDLTRYELVLPTGSIPVLMPRFLSGSERRRWLEEHVPDVDPRRPGERDRVQMIVAQHWQNGGALPLNEATMPEAVLHPSDLPGFFDTSLSIHGLAATVAEEKADRLQEQRPAIQQLGASKLKALILRIFDDIGSGDYCEGEVAGDYGLSKATLSRFAGHGKSRMGDLWRNTAAVLSVRKDFVELIRELGIRPRIAGWPQPQEARP